MRGPTPYEKARAIARAFFLRASDGPPPPWCETGPEAGQGDADQIASLKRTMASPAPLADCCRLAPPAKLSDQPRLDIT